jgi:hypothetical protein
MNSELARLDVNVMNCKGQREDEGERDGGSGDRERERITSGRGTRDSTHHILMLLGFTVGALIWTNMRIVDCGLWTDVGGGKSRGIGGC